MSATTEADQDAPGCPGSLRNKRLAAENGVDGSCGVLRRANPDRRPVPEATTAGKELAGMNGQTDDRSHAPQDRHLELERILGQRRCEILNEVHERMRDVRTERPTANVHGVLDAVEGSEADIQEDIELAVIQMKAETLRRINEALARLKEGSYGHCLECGSEISERRLRALPFAVRCKECEEAREMMLQREHVLAQRRDAASLFWSSGPDLGAPARDGGLRPLLRGGVRAVRPPAG
jgi:DnaK suppressor protein